jgi:hypothetical protein
VDFWKNSASTGNNQLHLGDNTVTTFAYGAVQDRSDLRDKTNVRDSLLGLTFIEKLRPVDYRWNYRSDYEENEEVEKMVDEIVVDPVTNERVTKPVLKKVLEKVIRVNDGSKARNRFHHGLIAQEVKQVLNDCNIDFDGFQDHALSGGKDVLSIGYSELIAPLIKSVQELSARVKELERNQK